VTPIGRICFELGDLEYWTEKLDLERYSHEVYTEKHSRFYFDGTFLKLKSKKLNFRDFKKTGLPNKNFLITIEFKTKEKDTPLFSVDSPIGEAGCDR
jgi:hypothetical protein